METRGVNWLGWVRHGRDARSIGRETAKEDGNGSKGIVLLYVNLLV